MPVSRRWPCWCSRWGIGANTAVFGVINAMLLKPRTGHPTGELVQVFSKDTTKPDVFRAFSYPNYTDLRAHTEVFASLAAHNFAMAGLEDNGRTRRVFINIVTGNFFDTFGVQLPIGRTFSAEEERPNANIPVAVLSYAAWQRMGGGSEVLGKTVRLNAKPFTVIGVAPQGFGGSMAMITPDMWVPTGVFDTMSNDFLREGTTGTLATAITTCWCSSRACNRARRLARLKRRWHRPARRSSRRIPPTITIRPCS